MGEGKDDRCSRPRGKSTPGLTDLGENPSPRPGGRHLASATCRAPPPARTPAPSQPGTLPGGWNGTEGASTPPLSPRFPNDRGGKFPSWDGAAFRRVGLTPRGRPACLGSPRGLAQPRRRFQPHLGAHKPDWGHLRRRVRPGDPAPARRLGSARGGERAGLTSGGGASSPLALLGRPAPAREAHSGGGRRRAPPALQHAPAWESEPAGVRRGRARVCVCASVCVCARV